jgi:hypothetical protein
VLFFTDSGWYEPRRELVANWAGLVISMSRTAKRELPDKVKRVQGEGDPQALPGLQPRPARDPAGPIQRAHGGQPGDRAGRRARGAARL